MTTKDFFISATINQPRHLAKCPWERTDVARKRLLRLLRLRKCDAAGRTSEQADENYEQVAHGECKGACQRQVGLTVGIEITWRPQRDSGPLVLVGPPRQTHAQAEWYRRYRC